MRNVKLFLSVGAVFVVLGMVFSIIGLMYSDVRPLNSRGEASMFTHFKLVASIITIGSYTVGSMLTALILIDLWSDSKRDRYHILKKRIVLSVVAAIFFSLPTFLTVATDTIGFESPKTVQTKLSKPNQYANFRNGEVSQ